MQKSHLVVLNIIIIILFQKEQPYIPWGDTVTMLEAMGVMPGWRQHLHAKHFPDHLGIHEQVHLSFNPHKNL